MGEEVHYCPKVWGHWGHFLVFNEKTHEKFEVKIAKWIGRTVTGKVRHYEF